jgi:hypothetical protein
LGQIHPSCVWACIVALLCSKPIALQRSKGQRPIALEANKLVHPAVIKADEQRRAFLYPLPFLVTDDRPHDLDHGLYRTGLHLRPTDRVDEMLGLGGL